MEDGGITVMHECECRKYRKAKSLERLSRLSEDQLTITFTGYWVDLMGTEAVDVVKALCQGGGWLTLTGGYGTGKTFLLMAAVNDVRRRGGRAVYITLPDALDVLRESYAKGGDESYHPLFESLRVCHFLALDELDKAHLTDWSREKLFQLVDDRYRHQPRRASLFALNNLEAVPRYVVDRMTQFPIVQITEGSARKDAQERLALEVNDGDG